MSEQDAAPVGPIDFKFRPIPVLVTLVLGFGLPALGAELVDYARHFTHWMPSRFGAPLPWLYAAHLMQALLALPIIGFVKLLVPADYGLHRPHGRSYVREAALWGLILGVVMTAVDCVPLVFAHTGPALGLKPTADNLIGWPGFEGIYVGPTGALLIVYLTAAMPGRLRLPPIEMNVAGIVVAAIFALAHIASIWNEVWWAALGQLVYTFVLGLLYAYWLERSKSVLAPMIGHNIADATEYILIFVMTAV